MDLFDVAIVGGGPAGAVTAERLARGGLRTALATWARHDSGRAWQTISPTALGMEPIAQGVLAGKVPATPVQGFASSWGGPGVETDAMLRPDGAVLAIQRQAVEALLIGLACKAGVQHFPCRVVEGRRKAGVWFLGTHDRRNLAARIVVDATGRRAAIARKGGGRLIRVDRLVCTSAVLQSPRPGDRQVRLEARPDGWTISIPAAPGTRLVSFYADARGRAGQRDAAHALSDWIAGNVAAITLHSTSAVTQFLESAVLPGVIAVGDAAQTLDPLSSGGLLQAVTDARSAADAILALPTDGGEALRRHEARRRLSMLQYLRLRQAYYAMENRWADQPFWSARVGGDDVRSALIRSRWKP